MEPSSVFHMAHPRVFRGGMAGLVRFFRNV